VILAVGLITYSGLPCGKGSVVIGSSSRTTKAANIVTCRSGVYAIALIINGTRCEGRIVNKYPIRSLLAIPALAGREPILNEVTIHHYPTPDIRAKRNARGCAHI
jgi:hypothetical protein